MGDCKVHGLTLKLTGLTEVLQQNYERWSEFRAGGPILKMGKWKWAENEQNLDRESRRER